MHVRHTWAWRRGFYSEIRYESHEYSGLAWWAIFWKIHKIWEKCIWGKMDVFKKSRNANFRKKPPEAQCPRQQGAFQYGLMVHISTFFQKWSDWRSVYGLFSRNIWSVRSIYGVFSRRNYMVHTVHIWICSRNIWSVLSWIWSVFQKYMICTDHMCIFSRSIWSVQSSKKFGPYGLKVTIIKLIWPGISWWLANKLLSSKSVC